MQGRLSQEILKCCTTLTGRFLLLRWIHVKFLIKIWKILHKVWAWDTTLYHFSYLSCINNFSYFENKGMVRGGRSKKSSFFFLSWSWSYFLWIYPRKIKAKLIFWWYNIENDGLTIYIYILRMMVILVIHLPLM